MKKLDRLTHHGEIKDGKLVLDNERWFNGMISLYDDTKVVVTVERKKNSRSRSQLGYLWGVVYPEISRHTGHSAEELHEIFKARFLRDKVLWRGAEMLTVNSTSRLNSEEMGDFITNVILEANEMSIEIEPPDKLYQFK